MNLGKPWLFLKKICQKYIKLPKYLGTCLMQGIQNLLNFLSHLNSIANPANLTALLSGWLFFYFISRIFFNSLNVEFFFSFSKGKIFGSIISVLVAVFTKEQRREGREAFGEWTWTPIHPNQISNELFSPNILNVNVVNPLCFTA